MVSTKSNRQGEVMARHQEPELNPQELTRVEQVAISELFSGYDRIAGESRTAALIPAEADPYSFAVQGGTSSLQAEVWGGSQRVKQAMSVKGKFGASIAGVFDFETSGSASQQSDISSYGVTVAVICERCCLVGTAKDAKVKDVEDIPALLETPQGQKNFLATYGDSYASSVRVGGRLQATFTMVATSERHQSHLEGQVGASGLIKALFLEGQASGAVSDFESKNDVTIKVACEYSGVDGIAPKSLGPQEVIDFAREFLLAPLNNPSVIGGELMGYEHVRELLNFEPVANNRNALLDSFWTTRALKVHNCYQQVRWITRLYDFFGVDMTLIDKKLYDTVEPVKKDLARMRAVVADYRQGPGGKIADLQKVPKLPSLENGIPSFHYVPDASDRAFGGNEGAQFNDWRPAKPQRISEIKLWAGGSDDWNPYVFRIDAKYEFLEYDSLGVSEQHTSRGNDGGNVLQGPLIINPGNFVERIDLRCGRYLDWIRFKPKEGRAIEGGGGGGSPDSRSVSETKRLVAFQGMTGGWVDMLKPIWYEIKDANWDHPVDMDI